MNAASHLADEAWARCSFDAVALAFLKAEWTKWRLDRYGDRSLIDQADLTDTAQNTARLRLLQVRDPLLQHVPPDTEWFEVRHLAARHFWQLRNIHHIDWSAHSSTNELLEMAVTRPDPLRGAPGGWEPILWAHGRGGPFTILEGNHRLTALAGALPDHQDYHMVAYAGVSTQPCGWHRLDGLW